MSKGSEQLTAELQKLVGEAKVVNEFYLGEGLYLDIYCPSYHLGIEYHGRQHFEYVDHFHKNWTEFKDAKNRDARKKELCTEMGIALVEFDYKDNLDDSDMVYGRLLTGLKQAPPPQDKPLLTKRQKQELETARIERKKRYVEWKTKKKNYKPQ